METVYEDPYSTENMSMISEPEQSTRSAVIENEHQINWRIVKEIIWIIFGILCISLLVLIGLFTVRSLMPSCENEECLGRFSN